ncbi:MAG: hypothetical protein ACM37W_27500 [Actinomycetota bacterium]
MKLTELSEAIATHSVEIADPLRQPINSSASCQTRDLSTLKS